MRWSLRNDAVAMGLVASLSLVAWWDKEGPDTNVVFTGWLLYLPFVFILVLYHGAMMRLVCGLLRKQGPWVGLLPTLPLVLWYVLEQGAVQVRYWTIGPWEAGILLSALAITTVASLWWRRDRQAAAVIGQ